MSQEIVLQEIMNELKDIRNDMATKDDIKNMATKDDIRNMATKDDIKNMATKDDIRDMATKDDLASIRIDLMNELEKTNNHLKSMDSKQHIIYEQTGKLSEYHTETLARLEQLATKEDLEYFDKKITEHDREIFKIKNKT